MTSKVSYLARGPRTVSSAGEALGRSSGDCCLPPCSPRMAWRPPKKEPGEPEVQGRGQCASKTFRFSVRDPDPLKTKMGLQVPLILQDGGGTGSRDPFPKIPLPPFFKPISQLKPRQDQVPRSHSSGVQRCQRKSGERKLIETFFFLKELRILVSDWRVLC